MIVRNIDHPEVVETRYTAHEGAAACMMLDSRVLEGLLFFAHAVLKPGKEIETHIDPYEEVYYLLLGRGVMTVGDERQEVTAGDAIWLPYGVPHSLMNDGDEDCVILVAAAVI
ncbi:MAG: cupin domain-containing protein [Deltaproteobacteria bacterium]|nr:cupin domain-containing protein [Deltaproteobacteria bacterium]